MDKQTCTIVDTVNGGGTVTTYDVGRMLEEAGKALKDTKLSCLRTAEACALETVSAVAEKVAAALVELGTLEASVYEAETAMIKRIDQAYLAYADAHKKLAARIEMLSPIQTGLPIYELNQLIDMANAVDGLSAKGWDRMVRLSKVLAGMEED